MPSTNSVVRELILSDTTYLGVMQQAAELTAIPLDDLLPNDGQYLYTRGSHRVVVIETDYTQGFTTENCFVAFVHLYNHTGPKHSKTPGFVVVENPQGKCPNCDSPFVFYDYGRMHCRECGNEVDC